MKERLIISFLVAVAMLSFSCVKEPVADSPAEGGIVLAIKCSDMLKTRTGSGLDPTGLAGVEEYNENLINTIDYFIYPSGASENSRAVLHGRVETGGVFHEDEIRVNVGEGTLNNDVFPGTNSLCDVYVIVNYPEVIPGDATSRNQLRALSFSTDFNSSVKRSSFIMAGCGTAELKSRRKTIAATGTILVKRLAVKLELEINVADSVMLEKKVVAGGDTVTMYEKWVPLPDGMQLYPVNLTSYGTIGEAAPEALDAASRVAATMSVDQSAPDYSSELRSSMFNYTPRGSSGVVSYTSGGKTKNYFKWEPFYCYPEKWAAKSPDEPFFKLVIPWSDGRQQKQFYYRIFNPVNYLLANRWQKMKVDVAILGSELDDTSVEITGNYCIADWSEQIITSSAQIVDARYLNVPKTTYTIYNQDELRIPFTTSHDCILDDIAGYSTDFSATDPVYSDISNPSRFFTISGNSIVFNHELKNVSFVAGDSDYDCTPYTFSVTIRHADRRQEYFQTISIVQYPSLVIVADKNHGTASNGYAFVNGNQSNDTYIGRNNGYWNYSYSGSYYEIYLGGNPTGISSGHSNSNTNMYVITTTALPLDTEYILADPRQITADNLASASGADWAVSAAAFYDGASNRRLKYYYPTIRDIGGNDLIAPKLRIASSHGACQSMLYDDAFRRCASYQEDGFPAGRWRVPTKAEIEYMAKLNADGKIPRLLGTSSGVSDYWCNSGYVGVRIGSSPTYSNSTQSDTKCYVRCVYDEWYWEGNNDGIRMLGTFTWGD